MKQLYEKYTHEDHEVWSLLFKRQKENLQHKACAEYLDCLNEMYPAFNENRVPDFGELDALLLHKTGWSIEVVKGLIPVEDFFVLLANKKFCSSTWLRKRHQLDYLEEPDMFHDSFGHIPLLMNPVFASFMESFGKLGVEFSDNKEIVLQLQRLYWFTIEFGLIGEHAKRKIYGAGILSSFGESNHVFESNLEIIPFSMEAVLKQEFRTDVIQSRYFLLESFEFLFEEMKRLTATLKREQRFFAV